MTPASLLDLAGDVRRWLAAGPRGHGRLLLSWDAARRGATDAREDRRAALLRLDDLAVRILEATLAVGAIGRIEVPIAGESVAGPVYAPEQVERLLETARTALFTAEDAARYATATRRDVRQRIPEDRDELKLHDLAGTLRRAHAVLSHAHDRPRGDATDQAADLSEAIEHARRLIDGALAQAPTEAPTP